MYLIDSHTHIYLPEFDNDREDMMKRAVKEGVGALILPAIDSSTHKVMMEMEALFENCHSMIGLHPCSVNQDFRTELTIIADWLRQRRFCAIGEIGLDFYWDRSFSREQLEAFHLQIGIAMSHDLPIAIHSRNAIDECIEVVEQYRGLRGVFHCFSGNEEQALRIMATGFYLGIGGVVTFKNAGLDKVLEKTGLSRVILETDAPYLAPVPHRGKRNEPSYIPIIAQKLADLGNCPLDEVAKLTTENTKKLFKL